MKPTLALQIYSVRDAYGADQLKTLKKIKALGYDAVEFFGLMSIPAKKMKAMLDECGLETAGYHILWSWLDEENFDSTVAYNKELGNDKIIVPALPTEMLCSPEAWELTNEKFIALNEKLKAQGMRFGFHSHRVEHTYFKDGSYGWKLFLDGTPKDIIAQLDLGNCMAGGGFDPVDELKACVDRAVTVHFKPYSDTTGYNSYIGSDSIDWKKAVELVSNSGVCEYIIVEYEIQDDFVGVQTSANALKKLL